MRTNIVIDDTLMNDALEPTGCKTKRETVELDLKTLLCLKETRADKGLQGQAVMGKRSGSNKNGLMTIVASSV